MNTFNNSKNKIFGLDLLRAIAIILVLVYHSFFINVPFFTMLHLYFFCFDGVKVFFVLSGFLITKILINQFTNECSIIQVLIFWYKRWMRTMPAFIFLSIFFAILFLVKENSLPNGFIKMITFTQNLYIRHNVFFRETWSLAIEEWFYFTFPLFIFCIYKFNKNLKRSFLLFCAFTLIIFPIYRFFLIFYDFDNIYNMHLQTLLVCYDCISYGLLAAWCIYYYPEWCEKNKNKLLKIGLALVFLILSIQHVFDYNVLTAYETIYKLTICTPISCFAVACCLPFLATWQAKKDTFFVKSVRYISLKSYSLYLVNLQLVSGFGINFLKKYIVAHIPPSLEYPLYFVFFYVCTFFLAHYLHLFVEVPFLKLRDKYIK
jgi:peptidoglycan/LPS O-acetylase OafA/YrhL